MKKVLLAAAALATLSLSATAQTRMTIHEEFTGENCPPCASTNPGFWSLLNGASNPSKIIHIAYMEPIPSSGWYYLRTKTLSDARASYYSVPFAPYGRHDGHVPNPTASSPGHPGFFTQADIDAEYAIPDSFNMTVSSVWNATYDSIITTVNVTCVAPWTGKGSTPNVKLRAALAQTNTFATPPGTNGEKHFENVVQAMYPDAGGTTIPGTWTTSMTQTFTIKGAVPSWVDKSDAPFMVVWIQDDYNKTIAQAGKATPMTPVPNDAAITAVTPPGLTCAADGSFSMAHTVTLKNSGSASLSSADIYYKVDGGAWASTPWTGSLAAGATATVTMPSVPVTVAGAGYHTVYDSVANPNSTADMNNINNPKGNTMFIESTTATAMPYSTSFEGTDYTKHYASDNASDGQTWGVFYNTTTPLGHTGSYAVKYPNYNATTGTANIYTLPMVTTTASSAIDFYVAYRQINSSNNDMLELVYSTNCGSSWTSLWSNSGNSMKTMAPDPTYYFFPAIDTQYRKYTVSLNTVPASSMLAFRATSDHGNNLWLDDVNIHAVTSVNDFVIGCTGTSVFPNPAKDAATLSFNLTGNSDVSVQLLDATGRSLQILANGQMNAGLHTMDINTTALASGVYSVVIRTEGGLFTERFSVVK